MKSNRQSEQQPEKDIQEELNDREEKEIPEENQAQGSEKSVPLKEARTDSAEGKDLAEMLKEKENAFGELTEKYMRLAAEYDNFRRRSQKEKESLYGEAVAEVIKVWLPVIDNLDRAEFAAEKYESKEAKKLAQGISLIQKQVDEVLEKLGVEEIDCCDQEFDPELHDAVMHVEDDNLGPSTIVEVLRKGYRRQDRIIRHVMVKVAN